MLFFYWVKEVKAVLKIIGIIIFEVFLTGVFFVVGLFFFNQPEPIERLVFSAESFGIQTVKSDVDFNSNGVDDYTDILLGAREDAKAKPAYEITCFKGGYPPDNIGVCTDVVWRAFKNAGYCLKDMVDNDIKNNPDKYPAAKEPDPNIDFRRVRNLKVFFESYAEVLTTDINDISEWQPGDIVIFEDMEHIGIISDKRNSKGQAFVIHNTDQSEREQDYLELRQVTGHYRFDASKIDESVLVAWHE
jgi:uncharacterized protein YijF (DUF1287 family)